MGQESITSSYGMHGYSNIKYLKANPMLAPLLVHFGEYPGSGVGGGGGYSTNFYSGMLRPEAQLLALLLTIFHERGNPFVHFYWRMVPLSHTLFRNLHPF